MRFFALQMVLLFAAVTSFALPVANPEEPLALEKRGRGRFGGGRRNGGGGGGDGGRRRRPPPMASSEGGESYDSGF
ncbi:hypothetical protein M408DRAFT_30870 [Serendipita vermifera MAFF 305830]|uniref:Uncharacterized protein n=1 Tax=Serendipita vermifera MAFF 305830 TaxID=933852 RepID=A0A0C2VZY1_SERVB|nr:hypothetical protein M408DRAFT_30870 [Serendipita vermifera MAFF 305830]